MERRVVSLHPGPRVLPRDNERYEFQELLGRGGMAVVYAGLDRTSGRRVALKRLQALPDPAKQQRNVELFEREYHTLSQLAHPRIVRVFDFGIDGEGAYYAMELLEGGDLQELAPLDWRRACALARDVCSALTLVHSRRFVHRDIGPRNVRCLKDGPAKLIDFGALAPAGPTKLLVGTPPCCAPESVNLQSLDARTDLFALGATLYYVLVGRHAFPARTFAALPELWRSGFARPSELVPGIPGELDALVLDLLRLEPDARPASASEVMQRLSAIDGEPATEQLGAASAYLAAPVLVGRDAALLRVRRRVERSTGGRSRSVLIQGVAGVGRTRFLDACALDATLHGQTVVRVDSDDAQSGDYGVVRALSRQLCEHMPQLAREIAAPVLGHLAALIPELALQPPPANDVPVPRPHVQRALHTWLTRLSQRRPFVLAIDDFHRIDEPSAAMLALLERDSTEHELCLLVTVESGASWTAEAARSLLEPLTSLQLAPLTVEESEQLLSSVFGAVPNVELLAHRARELCAGSPRDLLRLAQHLIDRGTVRYSAGAWILPRELDSADLPATLSDALRARIDALPSAARDLACALALCPDEHFTFEELGPLSGVAEPAQRIAMWETLTNAEIVKPVGDDVKLSHRSWVPLLRACLQPEREREFQQHLAELFERRDGQEFRAAQHWFRTGDAGRALDLLVLHAETSQEITARGPEIFLRYLLRLPEGWYETFLEGLRECDRLSRPGKHKYALLSRLLGIMSLLNLHSTDLTKQAFVFLRRDSGYDDYYALDPDMDPGQRLTAALTSTQARYRATPENERVLDLTTAIRDLARAVPAVLGPIATSLDVPALRDVPELTPFISLSPALAAGDQLARGVFARCTGRIPQARQIYTDLLARVNQPDRSGFEEAQVELLKLGVMNALGMLEAALGLSSCLQWADEMARAPAYEVNATIVRRVYCLFQGDIAAAEEQKRTADRLRIQNSGRQFFEGGYLLWEIQAHALCGDLTRVRHTAEDIAPFAKRYPHWLPVLRYATAEHHRMTRDFARASSELESVLAETAAGRGQLWAQAASAHVLTSIELGDYGRAASRADSYVTSAQRELGYVPDGLLLSAALAHAHTGQFAQAADIDALIARLHERGVTGVHLGVAHEVRARIALCMQDTTAFARHAELCRQSFFEHKNTALTAKYHRLLQEGRRTIGAGPERAPGTPDSLLQEGGTRIELALAGCRAGDQRARLALTLLTRQSFASAGVLFMLDPERRPVCVAHVGDVHDPESMVPRVQQYLSAQLQASAETSTQSDIVPEQHDWRDPPERRWRPLLLSHSDRGGLLITGIAVLAVPDQGEFVTPAQTASAISQFYIDRGATSLLLLADDD